MRAVFKTIRRYGRFGNRLAICLLVAGLAFWEPFAVVAAEEAGADRVVVDRIGRKVRIPAAPQRIACLFGPSYEKFFALGGAERVAVAANVLLPWNYALNPALHRMPLMDKLAAPDVEQLLALQADLVIYFPFVKQLERLSAAGLPVVVAYDGRERLKTLEAFIRDCYAQIRFYGELLGGKARAIAEDYCAYADGRIRKVLEVTARIPERRRPRVFFVCGQAQGPTDTQTRYSTAYWLVEAAGGRMLTYDEPAYFTTVSTEQLMLWDPDIILVSTLPSVAPILDDPRLRGLKAVREKRVFMIPEGQFYWSHFSTESFLCVLYLAKLFHPQLFPDLDLKRELQDYYARFYHYQLTDDEAQRILEHLPPQISEAASSKTAMR